jgi:hypothetical protein
VKGTGQPGTVVELEAQQQFGLAVDDISLPAFTGRIRLDHLHHRLGKTTDFVAGWNVHQYRTQGCAQQLASLAGPAELREIFTRPCKCRISLYPLCIER